jgi:DNA-binding LacI/PurR family transcriptional regulator/AraC-like DNA-binding protein
MAAEKKRIGLVLASIHTGVSLNVWSSFAQTAAVENATLFIFPGGRLDARQDFENLRNSVYYLVNEENLDGCISWSSTIRYTQSKEEFEHFHAGFDPLPYVTLSFKSPGHPCVEFDAYNGMKSLVTHCIKAHGAKKIAFLRGPDFHQSAQARFEGYYDALKEAGLIAAMGAAWGGGRGPAFFHTPLVTDPFNWGAGDAAAAQLFESRSLVPGRDFDTLIGSSDLMALGAVNYFAKHGYHVPRDYHAAGFNNSEESRILESPLSTVHLPYAELASESFKILRRRLSRKKHSPDGDILLGTDLIIRESCGCVDFRIPGEGAAAGKHRGPASSNDGAEETLLHMTASYLKLNAADMTALARPVIHSLFHEEPERSLPLFEKALFRLLSAGRDPENLLRLMADAGTAGFLAEKFRRLEPALYRIVFRIWEQRTAHARYEKEQWNTALNSLKCDLLGARDRGSLAQSLARHLPKIGINTAAIVLYGDEKTSICAGSFSPQGIGPQKEQRFPARLLVPAGLKSQYADGVFMVQPLFIENQSLGYFVHNVPINDGVIFEELRSAVSYALKGIALLEETVRAKRIAEQAERAKTEFLQTLEDGLYDPLQGVMDRLEKIEQKASRGLTKDLAELKDFVSEKEAQAGSLMDFTLSRIDELSLRKTVFDPEELLPGIGSFPLLLGDTARLAQCFSLVREQYGGENPAAADYAASLGYAGLAITFRRTAKAGGAHGRKSEKAEKARQFSLLLAERIILMHGGDFSLEQDRCVITLPWTTLTGQEPSKKPVSPQDHVLVLSDPASLPAHFFALPQIQDVEKAPPGRTAFIAWNAAGAGPEDLVKVASLRRKNEFTGVPFLCYRGEPPESAASLIDAVEFALKSPKKGAILYIGPPEYRDGGLEQLILSETGEESRFEKIHIDSMSAFNETVAEISPSLIVFNTLNPSGAAEVRRHPLTVMVPIIMISERIDNAGDVMSLSQHSRLIICHRAAALSTEFRARITALIGGDEILPPHTGILVKKAILYFGQHAESHISRWKLADTVNVSEDYLTRIFHREMGLSLWDYLNRYRIFLAAELLRQTDNTIQDIAYQTGFQDQSYFCRVFKKIYGIPPGHLRRNTPPPPP